MARVAYHLALANPHVTAEVVEINEFPDLAQRYQVRAVPLTIIDDVLAIPGAVPENVLVEQVVKVARGAGLSEPPEPSASGASTAAPPPQPEPPQRGQRRRSGIIIP